MTKLKFFLTLMSVGILLGLPSAGWAAEAQETWDSTYETSPANNDAASGGAAKIRATRQHIRERMQVEHKIGGGDTDKDDNGLHRPGSARAFYQSAAPTALDESMTDYAAGGGIADLNDSSSGSAGAEEDDVGDGRIWIDTDDNKIYVYDGVAGNDNGAWDEVVAQHDTVIDFDDQLLEGSFNYIYNGGFDIADGTGDATAGCTGCAAGAAGLPAGWDVASGTTPTVAYTDAGAGSDIRWGDGLYVVVTNAGSTNEGISYELDRLPGGTTFKVIARAKDDGTAVCTLSASGMGGAAFSSDVTTTDAWETLSGTFGTSASYDDDVLIVLTTTGADTTVCNWDHVSVQQVGDTATDRDEVATPGVVAVYDTDTAESGVGATWADNPNLSASFVPPSNGWVVQVGYHISALDTDADEGDGIQCRLELGGTEVTGTVTSHQQGQGDSGTVPFNYSLEAVAVNINPTVGTELVYTVACQEIYGGTSTFNANGSGDDDAGQSNLWLIAYPPH